MQREAVVLTKTEFAGLFRNLASAVAVLESEGSDWPDAHSRIVAGLNREAAAAAHIREAVARIDLALQFEILINARKVS